MKWRLNGLLILALLVVLAPAALVNAQQGGAAPALMIAGDDGESRNYNLDLYRWDESSASLERLTDSAFKSTVQLSPDGSRMAYLTVPPIVLEASVLGHSELFGVAWNVEIYDVATGERTVAVYQPEGLTYWETPALKGALNRSGLTWSPDGTMLAWTEQTYPAGAGVTPRLVVYDLAQGTTRTLDDALPFLWQSDDGLPYQVAWGQAGLVVFTNDPAGEYSGTLRLYDPQQGLLRVIDVGALLPDSLSSVDRGAPPQKGPQFVQNGTAEVLILRLDGFWYQVDLQAGTLDPFWNTVEVVSAANPDQSLRVVWVPTDNTNLTFEREIWSPAGEKLYGWDSGDNSRFLDAVAIAPGGDAVAFYEPDQGLVIWRAGTLTPVDTSALTWSYLLGWGPVQWRVSVSLSPDMGG